MDAATRSAVRSAAAEHVRALGLVTPPFDHFASLEARQLELLPDPLESILADSGLPEEARDGLDGFVHLGERVVCLRQGLHRHQRRFALLHEVAHDVLPWQRELLHYCPIFSLSPDMQRAFEREANLFAVECSYLADRFVSRVAEHPDHLNSAVLLADEHVMSYRATFRHYVECHPGRCILLVSTLVEAPNPTDAPTFVVRQYVASPTAACAIAPGQRFISRELASLVSQPAGQHGVIDHRVRINGLSDEPFVAQSFWNTYQLFTLIWLAEH